MGFETGQDLYNKGFQRSQQRLQTQQRNQQLKLQQDSQAQRGKLLDMQLRGEEQRLGEKTRQLNVAADYRKRSSAALLEMQDAVAGARTQQGEAQAWYENRDKLEPEIFLNPDNRKYYETWVQKGVLATAEGNAIMAEEQDRKLLAIAKLTHQKNQRLADYTTRTTAFKITGKTYTDDADGTATAQSDIFAAQARGMYIKGDEPVPENLDLDGDGRISAAEVDAAQGDVVGLGRGRETKAKDLEWEHKKTLATMAIEGRETLAAQKAEAARVLAMSAQFGTGMTSGVRDQAVVDAALTGSMSMVDLTKIDSQLASAAGMKRIEFTQIVQDPKTRGVDAIALSGVFGQTMGVSEKQQLMKAMSVKGQIERLGSGGYIDAVNTGRWNNKTAEVRAWFNTEGSRDLQVLEGLLNAVIPNLARGVYGEIGVLTDKDVDLYKGTFISPKNEEEVNKALFGLTQKLVDGAIMRQLEMGATGGSNVSGYRGYYEKLTGTHLSPHIEKMISPGGGGQGGMRPGGGSPRPSAPPVPAPPQVNGQNFDTDEDAATAAVMMAASLPPGTPFTDVTVGGAARNVVPNNQDVREWAEQYIGRQYDHPEKGWTDYVDRGWIEKWEKEDKAKAPTPEATTPKPTEPEAAPSARRMDPSVNVPPTTAPAPATDPDGEEVVDKITQDYINDQEYEDEAAPAPAPTETMEPPPVTTATGSTPSAPGSSLVIRESKGDAPFSESKGAFTAGTYKGKKGKLFRRTDGKYEFESGDSSWTLTKAEVRGFAPSR
jgi:hypothetical protein